MSQPEAITQGGQTIPCHCLIAHPEKPKFLVIQHTDRWSPPILHAPADGRLMYKPAVINQGMMQKYGLRTSVLRIVAEMQNYALIELEMHASSRQQMKAVWVGLEEYAQFRTRPEGEADPIEAWLKEQEEGTVPSLRAPWQRRGWYKQAEQWIDEKLIRLSIQATGSIQQFKAGWPSACLLRVATVRDQVFFKAAYNKPPGEALLTQLLSERWPDLVAQPLAIDRKRNWMLSRDYRMKETRPDPRQYPEFARRFGRFQVEAMERMDDWRAMSCPVMDLAYLTNQEGKLELLVEQVMPQMSETPPPLTAEMLERLPGAIEVAGRRFHELSAFDVPDSLSHLDFRPDNYFIEENKYRIIDWADVAISHPFMALCQTLDFFERYERDKPAGDAAKLIDDSLKDEMTGAYLSAFAEWVPEADARKAFELARSAFPLFWFVYLAAQTCIIEAETPQWQNINSLLKKEAMRLVERFAPET